jgi:hypothetical protein
LHLSHCSGEWPDRRPDWRVFRQIPSGVGVWLEGKNSWLCKGLAHLSGTQLTSALSRYDDIPHVDGLKKTQGGGESR